MNNADFQRLVASSGANVPKGAAVGGPKRFDLKDVAAFDIANKKSAQRREMTAKARPSRGSQYDDSTSSSSYRDRAAERRNGQESELEIMAARLRPEETQHLGGDVEHTHLVKGLDMALLQKMRGGPPGVPVAAKGPPGIPVGSVYTSLAAQREKEKESERERDQAAAPKTELGRRLKALLPSLSSSSSSSSTTSSSSSSAAHLQRTVYDFRLHDAPDANLPPDALAAQHFSPPGLVVLAAAVLSADEGARSVAGRIGAAVLAALCAAWARLSSSSSSSSGPGGKKRGREEGDAVAPHSSSSSEAAAECVDGGSILLVSPVPGPDFDIFSGLAPYVPPEAEAGNEGNGPSEAGAAAERDKEAGAGAASWAKISSTASLFDAPLRPGQQQQQQQGQQLQQGQQQGLGAGEGQEDSIADKLRRISAAVSSAPASSSSRAQAKAKRGAEAASAYDAILGLGGTSSEYDIYPDSAFMDTDFDEHQADREEEKGERAKGGGGARKRKKGPLSETKPSEQ